MARTTQGSSFRHFLRGGPAAIALAAGAAACSVPTIAPPGSRPSLIIGADPAVAGRGATLYVSAAGSDVEPCGSQSRPCRQIRRAIEMAHPGDTILVAPGMYDAFDVAKDGLVIRAQDPERRPVISWKKELGQGELIRIRASNVVIDGLTGYRAFYCGLRVSGDRLAHPEQISIRNCVFGDDGELGIMTNDGVRGLLIE